MRSFVTLTLSCLLLSGALAQNNQAPLPVPGNRTAIPMDTQKAGGAEFIPSTPLLVQPKGEVAFYQTRDVVISEAVVGQSYYDLQTNGTVDNRILLSGNEIRTAWIMSLTTGSYPDRGTGFNEYTGSWDEMPTTRLEDVRTGWPSLVETASGRVLNFAHVLDGNGLQVSYRDPGSDSWSSYSLDIGDTPGHIWCRATVGGPDGNTIHLICHSLGEQFDGADYFGQSIAYLYFRSTDAGDTWDVQNMTFPELGPDFYLNAEGDQVAIHAQGDKVAFAGFNYLSDSFVMVSEDNGDSWTYSSLTDFPVDFYEVDGGLPDDQGEDFDGDGLFDDYLNTDGTGDVLITPDGIVHVFYGMMYITDTDLEDELFNFFPGMNGLAYWNSTMEENSYMEIAYALDLDESGFLEFDGLPSYRISGVSSMPTTSHDADGNIYVIFSAVVETHSTGTQNYRHLYLLRSTDNGETWDPTTVCDITPDVEFDYYEAVYASQVKSIDDEIHLIYQRDFEPGGSVQGDLDPSALNEIVYLGIQTDQIDNCINGDDIEIVGIEEPISPDDIEIYPNPSSEALNIVFDSKGTVELEVFDLTGKLVHSEQINATLRLLDVSTFAPGIYVMKFTRGGSVVSKQVAIQ